MSTELTGADSLSSGSESLNNGELARWANRSSQARSLRSYNSVVRVAPALTRVVDQRSLFKRCVTCCYSRKSRTSSQITSLDKSITKKEVREILKIKQTSTLLFISLGNPFNHSIVVVPSLGVLVSNNQAFKRANKIVRCSVLLQFSGVVHYVAEYRLKKSCRAQLNLKGIPIQTMLREDEIAMNFFHKNIARPSIAFYYAQEVGAETMLGPWFQHNVASFIEEIRDSKKNIISNIGSVVISAVEGLCELHKKGYVHRGLNPSSLAIRKTNGKYEVVIQDLHLARLETELTETRKVIESRFTCRDEALLSLKERLGYYPSLERYKALVVEVPFEIEAFLKEVRISLEKSILHIENDKYAPGEVKKDFISSRAHDIYSIGMVFKDLIDVFSMNPRCIANQGVVQQMKYLIVEMTQESAQYRPTAQKTLKRLKNIFK